MVFNNVTAKLRIISEKANSLWVKFYKKEENKKVRTFEYAPNRK